MARVKGNHIMKNVRGMLGKQVVFKERLGTTYVAAAPYVDENRVATPAEQGNRNIFRKAIELGKQAIGNAELKKMYASLAKQNQTAYNVAVSDARLPPKINSLLVHGYSGAVGSCILIQATDNIKVKRVQVSIYDSSMTLIEEGEAADNGDNLNWIYTATSLVENVNGYTIEARAFDLAGNVTIESVVV